MPSAAVRGVPASSAASTRPRTCAPSATCASVTAITAAVSQARRRCAGTSIRGGAECRPTRVGPIERVQRRVHEQRHDHQRDDQVHRHDPRRQLVRDDTAAEPPLKPGQQKRRDGRPQNPCDAAMMADRADQRREDQEADRDAEEAVRVLGPHQRRIELRGIERRRQCFCRGGRDPRTETARPVRTSQACARRAHQTADENQHIRRRRGPHGETLKRRHRSLRYWMAR